MLFPQKRMLVFPATVFTKDKFRLNLGKLRAQVLKPDGLGLHPRPATYHMADLGKWLNLSVHKFLSAKQS